MDKEKFQVLRICMFADSLSQNQARCICVSDGGQDAAVVCAYGRHSLGQWRQARGVGTRKEHSDPVLADEQSLKPCRGLVGHTRGEGTSVHEKVHWTDARERVDELDIPMGAKLWSHALREYA